MWPKQNKTQGKKKKKEKQNIGQPERAGSKLDLLECSLKIQEKKKKKENTENSPPGGILHLRPG